MMLLLLAPLTLAVVHSWEDRSSLDEIEKLTATDRPSEAAYGGQQRSLTVVSYNVFTLNDSAGDRERCEGLVAPRKAAMLQEQMLQKDADIVALQETRSNTAGCWTTGGFVVVGSAADRRGRGGCQIWLRSAKAGH